MRRILAIAALVSVGCSTPAERFAERAMEQGLVRREIEGLGFQHAVFSRPTVAVSGELHVYLDGDGTPWLGPGQIAPDPSSRSPLVLALMARDAAPSVLVGRPCYYRTIPDPACTAALWTSHRYSEAVVASMTSVVARLLVEHPETRVTLIGYSGGGALAVLLAQRLRRTHAVITVGANLDTAAWTTLHRYTPLTGSLNPSEQPPLSGGIVQTHYFGAEDSDVPAASAARFFSRQKRVQPEVLAGFDHHCCWAERWPAILARAKLVAHSE
ncbi:MAG: alpha/beta hydrolase [Gammaproteobacteria bacterium]|nr:alpha/beta hydrolase [Gammaproteobacteria bacterium]